MWCLLGGAIDMERHVKQLSELIAVEDGVLHALLFINVNV
jgi:hypothetical protein